MWVSQFCAPTSASCRHLHLCVPRGLHLPVSQASPEAPALVTEGTHTDRRLRTDSPPRALAPQPRLWPQVAARRGPPDIPNYLAPPPLRRPLASQPISARVSRAQSRSPGGPDGPGSVQRCYRRMWVRLRCGRGLPKSLAALAPPRHSLGRCPAAAVLGQRGRTPAACRLL